MCFSQTPNNICTVGTAELMFTSRHDVRTFKALKQLVKCSFKLKKFDEMRQRYKELLEFSWPGLTRNHTEKVLI